MLLNAEAKQGKLERPDRRKFQPPDASGQEEPPKVGALQCSWKTKRFLHNKKEVLFWKGHFTESASF